MSPFTRRVAPAVARAVAGCLSVAALASVLAPSDALAQVDPLRRPPVVFVILDTSGSMSYVQGPELVTPVCSVDALVPVGTDPATVRDPGVPYEFSRDMIAKEVLTGTFENFWCRERARPSDRFDAGYPIPWYTPEYSTQLADGILDVNRERAKFAFATFDTILKSETDATGGWSVGPNSQFLASLGAKTNVGLQNETSAWGRLYVPPPTDATDQIVAFNQQVQDEILRAVPYGGTPIAPALEDTTWLLQNHANLVKKTATTDGDPYRSCRAKNILLITDGRPNLGEGTLGYKTSVDAAERLFKNGYSVHVVGFNLEAGTTTLVNDIAAAGGTTSAHIAQNPTQLGTALSAILGKATPGLASRTDSVFTDNTGSIVDLQYQINTAYGNAVTTDIDLAGYFEVTAYRCEDGCRDAGGGAGPCVVSDVRSTLNARSTARDMYFALDGKREKFVKNNVALTADALALPSAGSLSDLAPALIDSQYRVSGDVLGDASDPAIREKYRSQVIDLMRAEASSRRRNEKLGGIWHSTPVLQTNLSSIDVQIPSFTAYKNSIANRPTVGFTMTHDGFIHAFLVGKPNTTTPSGTKWLDEIWALAPQALVPRFQELGTKLQVLADGRMTLKDIRLERKLANATTAVDVKQWRSILVAPYRQGARGLIAVDVTDPFDPIIRWEISNKRRCWLDDPSSGNTKCESFTEDDRSDFRNLGFVHAKPQIGTIFIQVDNALDKREVAAAFFPCGEAVAGEPESGKCFMVVRLDTGEKIKEFRNGNSSVLDDNGATDNVSDTLDHAVVGDPAAYNTFLGTFVSRLFVGDAGGQLWRIDVSTPNPKDWKMTFFFDIYDDLASLPMFSASRSALRAAPAISPVPQRGQLVLVFGTGDIDYAKEGEKTVVYSIKERLAFSAAGASTGVVTHELNWRRELNLGENLTSRPIIFGRAAYFTSFEADKADACAGGTGRIWGVDFLDHVGTNPVAALDKDGDVATPAKAEYIELADTVPYGATVVSRPACVGNQGVEAASGGGNTSSVGGGSSLRGATSGNLELVVQTGSVGATNAHAEPAKGATPAVKRYSQKLVRPPKQIISVSWGEVQNL